MQIVWKWHGERLNCFESWEQGKRSSSTFHESSSFQQFAFVAAKLGIQVNQWIDDPIAYNIKGESHISVQGTKVEE